MRGAPVPGAKRRDRALSICRRRYFDVAAAAVAAALAADNVWAWRCDADDEPVHYHVGDYPPGGVEGVWTLIREGRLLVG